MRKKKRKTSRITMSMLMGLIVDGEEWDKRKKPKKERERIMRGEVTNMPGKKKKKRGKKQKKEKE